MSTNPLRILGVIPARYASSRFPGKPLIDLKGKTMIQRVYEGVKKSNILTDIVVATDDARIEAEVLRFGGKVMMTSAEHPSGTDRCGEVARKFYDYDVVINIQGDEPLVDYRQIDQLATAFIESTTNIATLGIKQVSIEDILNTNRIKIVVDNTQNALYFSRSPIPNFANFKENPLAFYPFYRHIESLEQLRWLFYGYKIKVVETNIETPNIDVPEDVEKVISLL